MSSLWALGALLVAVSIFYVVARVRLARALDADAYRRETATRMAAASWRRHGNVIYLDGYTYIPEQTGGGGSDARQRLEAAVGVVGPRRSLAGGQGSTSTACRCCGEVGGHTGQCPVVS